MTLKQISLNDPLSPLLPECPMCLQITTPSETERGMTCWTNANHSQGRSNPKPARSSPALLEDNQWVERCPNCQNTVPIRGGDFEQINKTAWELNVRHLNNQVSCFLGPIKDKFFQHFFAVVKGKEERTRAQTWAINTRETINFSEPLAQKLLRQGDDKGYDTDQVKRMLNEIAEANRLAGHVEKFVQHLQN